MTQLTLIAALDRRRTIGYKGDLPWHLPADLRRFKRITMGHPLVMGRATYESIGRPLPGRENIVLTRNPDFEAPGCTVVHSIDDAIARAEGLGADEAMIIGGESVFRRTLARADRMHLTVVDGDYPGDTFFPDFDGNEWKVVSADHYPADDENEAAMTFVQLEATADPPLTVGESKGPGELPEVLRQL